VIAAALGAIPPAGSGTDPVHVVVDGGGFLADLWKSGLLAIVSAFIGFLFGRIDRHEQRTHDRRTADIAVLSAQLQGLLSLLAQLSIVRLYCDRPVPVTDPADVPADIAAISVAAGAAEYDAVWLMALTAALDTLNQASMLPDSQYSELEAAAAAAKPVIDNAVGAAGERAASTRAALAEQRRSL
jgi:hypothetical protein